MALTFPANPTVGQTYTTNDYTYAWDGVKWSSVKREVTNVFDTVNHMAAHLNLQIGDWVKVISPLSDYVIQVASADIPLDNGLHAREITQATAAPVTSPRQFGDGVETRFDHPAGAAEPDASFFVTIDGIYQTPGISYVAAIDGIHFTDPVPDGAAVDVMYFKPVTVGIIPGADVSAGEVSAHGGVSRSLEERFSGSRSILDFGAVGDGVFNDTAAFEAATRSPGTVIIPDGLNILVDSLTIDTSDLNIKIAHNSRITMNTSALGSNSGLIFTGSYVKIEGGSITTDTNVTGRRYANYILYFNDAYASTVSGVKVFYPIKSTYVGDGVNIPYNQGCIGMRSPNSVIEDCVLYNAEGAGIYNYRENLRIQGNRIFNNILGIALSYGGSSGFGDSVIIDSNHIYQNNATLDYSGADGILSWKETRGHSITNNVIEDSGEHGTYIQSRDCSIIGNTVRGNQDSGIKCGGAKGSTVTGNVCYDNGRGAHTSDGGEIYIQSPFGNMTVTGNSCSNNVSGWGSFGIRVVWLNDKDNPVEEDNVIVSNNVVTGTFANPDIRVSGYDKFTVTGNNCEGTIHISQSTAGHPLMDYVNVSTNNCTEIYIDKVANCLVSNNYMDDLRLGSGAASCIIKGNVMRNQTSQFNMNDWVEISDNRIVYSGASPMLLQGSNAANCSDKRVTGNVFTTTTPIISFTSEGVSGDRISLINNEFTSASTSVSLISGWCKYCLVTGNRSPNPGGVTNFRNGSDTGFNIVTNNIGDFFGVGTNDIKANNAEF